MPELVTRFLGTSGVGVNGQYRFELELSSKRTNPVQLCTACTAKRLDAFWVYTFRVMIQVWPGLDECDMLRMWAVMPNCQIP